MRLKACSDNQSYTVGFAKDSLNGWGETRLKRLFVKCKGEEEEEETSSMFQILSKHQTKLCQQELTRTN